MHQKIVLVEHVHGCKEFIVYYSIRLVLTDKSSATPLLTF